MAYRIFVDSEMVFDPIEDNTVIQTASISQSINAAAYLDFSVSPEYNVAINEGESQVEVRWDSQTLFYGRVTDVTIDTEGWRDVSCVSDVDLLNNVLVRPYSTDGSVGNTAPTSMSAYFNWLIEQYNLGIVSGKRIDVGVNQGNQIVDYDLVLSSDDYPSVAEQLENNILNHGGYLDYHPYATGGTLDLYSDLHDSNAQIIDFGENITSINVKRDSTEQYNAVVPYGQDAEGNIITLSDATSSDLALIRNAGYMVKSDAMYDPAYVSKYGYREDRYDVGSVETMGDMIRSSIAHLRTMLASKLTIECKAVDMALYREGYEHLRVGQAVRVRSTFHGVDEYLAVNDMQLNLLDPAQTTYTLGVSYDTLTGQQSAFLAQLNAGINHALDVADESLTLGQTAVNGSLQAVQTSEEAKNLAQNAYDKATDAITGLGGVTGQVTDLDAEVEQVRQDAAEAAQAAQEAGDRADEAWEEAERAAQDAQGALAAVTEGVEEAKQAAQDAATRADAAAARADAAASGVTEVTTRVNGVETDLAELATEVSGVSETAEGALSAATKAQQDVTGFKTTVEQTYQTKDAADAAMAREVLDRNSAIEQSAGEIRSEVSQNYVDKATGETLATKSEVQQTAQGIRQEVSQEYQVKGDYLTEGEAAQAYASRSELEQTAGSILARVEEGDLLHDGSGPVIKTGPNAGMPLESLTVYGSTRQNLWVNASKSVNGIAATANADGSLTISGTASAATGFYFAKIYTLRPGMTYTVSVDKKLADSYGSGNSSGGCFYVSFRSADDVYIRDDIFGVGTLLENTKTVPSNAAFAFLRINVAKGTTVSGTYRVMLNEGSTAEPWCRPGLNGVDELSVVTAGKNLFKTNFDDGNFYGVAVKTNSDGSISFDGTQNFTSQRFPAITYDFPLPPGTYTMSCYDDTSDRLAFRCELYGIDNKKTDIRVGHSVVVTEDMCIKRVILAASLNPGQTYDGTYHPQLEIGSEATDWVSPALLTTPIPLLGHALNSLPDGTRDELTVDASGNVMLTKRVGELAIPTKVTEVGFDSASSRIYFGVSPAARPLETDVQTTDIAIMCDKIAPRTKGTAVWNKADYVCLNGEHGTIAYVRMAGSASSGDIVSKVGGGHILYPLATPETISLGKVSLPALEAGGATVLLSAPVPADFDATWYGTNASALGNFASKAELEVTADGIRASVTEAAETADAAMEKATTVETTAEGIRADLTETTSTANSALTKSNSLQVTVDGLTQDVEAVTETADAAMEKSSSVEAGLSGFKSTVSSTYETKADADKAIKAEASARESAIEQTEKSIKQYVSDTYVDKETGKSYATKSEVTETADGIRTEVSQEYQSKDGMSSYYTKAQVDTKVNSITTKVTEVSKTANGAMEKASEVEQTASGIQVTLTEGYHSASGTSGTAGYIGIATIKIASSYANAPIYFELTSRNKKATPVWVRFANSDSTDPALSSITADGDIKAYIRKTATSTWQLVVQKSESYDSISVTGFSKGGAYMEGKVAVTWTNVMLTSLPSGCTQATVLAGKRNGSEIDTAQSTADAAKTAAATAQTTATNAAKTATNFLRFDSSGLCVGNVSGTLQGNVLLNSSGMQVRNGTTVYASYGATEITLGRNSADSTIRFCNNQGTITGGSSGGIQMDGTYMYVFGTNTTQLGSTSAASRTNISCGATSGRIDIGNNNRPIYAYVGSAYHQLVAVQRLYNPYTDAYLTTADTSEANGLVSAGWQRNNSHIYYAFAG